MNVESILGHKGTEVATIGPGATVRDAAALIADRRIGALVVSGDGRTIEGILSERDIVNGLAARGADLLDEHVDAVMTSPVTTCVPDDTVAHLMATMTHLRIRHLPVIHDGALAGIVSIGDVVKRRVEEMAEETELLRDYIYSR